MAPISSSHALPRAATYLLLALAIGLATSLSARAQHFAPESRIWIEGTSTIHDWTCEVDAFSGTVSLDQSDVPAAATVTVPVPNIDCDNGTMNDKLRDALGSSPVRYTLASAAAPAAGSDGWFTVRTAGTLRVNDQSKPASITLRGKALDNGRVRWTGQYAFRLTSFDVDPPRAMFGTLRTGDEVTVHFDVTTLPGS